jgi:protein-disulfide isomerase
MTSRRAVLGGLAAATALAGCAGSRSTETETDTTTADGAVGDAPLPDGDSTYARMGTDGPTVTYYGNWKCPFCAEFSVGSDRVFSMPELLTGYVAPGDVTLEHRSVAYIDGRPFLGPDAPRAARAGLAVWDRDPASYWAYHEHVMANQPSESEEWATPDRLVGFAEAAGVEPIAEVRADVESGAHEDAVRASTEPFLTAFERSDSDPGTPAVVVDGVAYSPFQPERFREALDTLVG